jgi:hypothetical protein
MALRTDDELEALDAAVSRAGGADALLGRVVALHAKAYAKDEGEAKAVAYQLPYLSIEELEQASQSVAWTVKGLVPADSIGMMFGGSGTFKSFIALDLALHVAHGLRWLGFKTKKGPVIYIAAEGGTGLWRRIKAWHIERGLDWHGLDFHIVPVAVDLMKDATAVVAAAKAKNTAPALVVVDTLSQTFDGEENSANEIAAYLRNLGTEFRALWRCVVLVIHHSGHSATERPRGSSAMRANVDFLIGVFRSEKEMLATISWSKQKDGEPPQDASFGLKSHVLGQDEDGDDITSLSARFMAEGIELEHARQMEFTSGRSGKNGQLLGCIQNGMPEKELRKVFYDTLETTDPHARKMAFYRARDWAVKAGFIEVANGTVIVLKDF